MSKTATIQARLDPQLKKEAESVLHKMGMTSTEAIRLFYTQVALRQEIPFKIKIPNQLTQRVLTESEKGENVEGFSSTDELYASWE